MEKAMRVPSILEYFFDFVLNGHSTVDAHGGLCGIITKPVHMPRIQP
jgi:hypothetical protein